MNGQHMASLATIAAHFVADTPLWVPLLLAYLVWQSVLSARDRVLPVWRVLVIPALFIAVGLSRLLLSHDAGMASLMIWIVAAALLCPVGFFTSPRPRMEDASHLCVLRSGSIVPLIRNISLFALQYSLAAIDAFAPGNPVVTGISHFASGATTGYFLGWAAAFLLHLRNDAAGNVDPIALELFEAESKRDTSRGQRCCGRQASVDFSMEQGVDVAGRSPASAHTVLKLRSKISAVDASNNPGAGCGADRAS